MRTTFVGIDPGLSGAVARLGSDRPVVWDTPTFTEKNSAGKIRRKYAAVEMRELLLSIQAFDQETNCLVYLEKQQAFPKQGGVSNFTTGYGYGLWVGILTSLKIPFETVHPTRWKPAMLDGMGRDKKAAHAKAQALYPTVDLGKRGDAGRAEALLIATWGQRLHGGEVKKS